MFSSTMRGALCLAVLLGMTQGQLLHLDFPNVTWTTFGGELGVGNGLFLSPDGSLLVGTFLDGSVRFMNPMDGSETAAPYFPESQGVGIRGYGGMTFSFGNGRDYMVYAVTHAFLNAANSFT